MKLALVNSDARMELAGRLLAGEGHAVTTLADSCAPDWQSEISHAEGLLLPYPYSLKEGKVPGWQDGGVEPLLERLPSGALVMAGMGLSSSCAAQIADARGLRIAFYSDDPVFAARNAAISAEAAVCAAMQRSGCMLDEQRVLLLGYGLFGKAIAWRIRALGAKVWVAARRHRQRQEAAADGAIPVPPEQLLQLAPGIDLVLNTIPAVVADRKLLEAFPEHTIFLELASPPYGIDLHAAAELEKQVAVLPGLPAQYAPLSAAKVLKDAVLRQCKEVGI